MAEADKQQSSVLLVIPCFNEAANIGGLLGEIAALPERYDTLVIDDGSTDRTFEEASQRSPTVRLPHNLGIGGCLQTGLIYAHRKGYEYCIQVDGDGQHPPAEIAKLVAAARTSGANLVIGSRFCDVQSFRSTFSRRVGIALISKTLRWLCGQTVLDPTSGFRLMDRSALALFSRDYPADFPEPITLAKAMTRGLRLQEVGVRMRERQHGTSSIGGLKNVAYIVRVISYIALARLNGGRDRGV